MPREVLEFRVIVASPADQFQNRKIVFDVIEELNRIFEVQSISVRGLGWEQYVAPGIDTDVQSVVNQQLLREYDILIALFGTRLGSPTPRAASGTVEEIEQAISNPNKGMGQNRLQIYFCDKLESVSGIDVDELKKVFEFRNKLKSMGVLYNLFKDDEDLQKTARINLQRSIHLRA